MRAKILREIAITKASINTLEAVADDIVATAYSLENEPIARVLRALARHTRVDAMQLRAALTTLQAKHDSLYGRDPPP